MTKAFHPSYRMETQQPPSLKMSIRPTILSLLKYIEEKAGDFFENFYRKLNATDSVNVKEQVAQAPRKLKQVQNMMQNLVQKLRFSQDSLYNLHNPAFDGTF